MRESDGFGSMVDDDEVMKARAHIARKEGVHLSIEGAACFVAYRQNLESGRVGKTDQVVLFNCASGLKADLPATNNQIDKDTPLDFSKFG